MLKIFFIGLAVYLVIGVIVGVMVLIAGDYPHPIGRFLMTVALWPAPVIRALFGGGPLG